MTAARPGTSSVLVIACGAIAAELVRVVRLSHWPHIRFRCLPPGLHNRPERIVPAIRHELEISRPAYAKIFVAYGDCGTAGALDALLTEFGAERLPGAHCYEFLSGSEAFGHLATDEPRSFYLTDYLARNFDRLVISGLGLDRYPELLPQYFGNYRRLVYLAQQRSPTLQQLARQHAARLGLEYQFHYCGDGPLRQALKLRIGPPPGAPKRAASASQVLSEPC